VIRSLRIPQMSQNFFLNFF